jgi:hypothetical protein
MFSGHNMTGRLIYQDGSGALLQQPLSLAGSGQNFANRTEAEDSALPNSRPTFNVITATTAAGYRWRWSCSLLGAAISPSLIRLRRNCSQTNGDSDELFALSVTSWLCNACVPAADHCGSTRASRGAEIMSRVAIHGFGRIGPLADESGTRWRCLRPRFDFRSLDVLDRLQPRTLVRAGRDKARAQKGRPVSSFGLPPQRPSRIFGHRASKRGGSAKTTAPSATTLTIRERWRSRDGANDVARRVIDALK